MLRRDYCLVTDWFTVNQGYGVRNNSTSVKFYKNSSHSQHFFLSFFTPFPLLSCLQVKIIFEMKSFQLQMAYKIKIVGPRNIICGHEPEREMVLYNAWT